MKFLLKAAMCLVLAVLTGCASSNKLVQPDPLPRGGTGYVAATLVARNESYDPKLHMKDVAMVSAAFHAVDNPKSIAFWLSQGSVFMDPRLVLPEPDGQRILVLTEVKPGKYKMGALQGSFPGRNKTVAIEAIDPPVIEVREGEVTYAGSLQLINLVGENLLGMAVPGSARMVVKNEYRTDVSAIKVADPRVKDMVFTDSKMGKTR